MKIEARKQVMKIHNEIKHNPYGTYITSILS